MAGERAIATSFTAAGQAPRRRAPAPGWLPNWGVLSALLICLGLAVLALYLFSPNWFILDRMLPVGLRSPLQADYSVDPFNMARPPVDDRIIADVLADQRTAREQDPVEMLATLVEPLRSPVPSITPGLDSTPGIVATSAPSAVPTEIPPPTATRTTAATGTQTSTPTITWTASATAIPYQPSPTSGTIHTPTKILPTATLTLPVATTRPASTATRAATATAAVTATAVPTIVPPTNTPRPPATATPRPPVTATQQPYPPPAYP